MKDNLEIRTDTRFTKPMKKKLDIEARKLKMNFSELVRFVLAEWLRGRGWMERREP